MASRSVVTPANGTVYLFRRASAFLSSSAKITPTPERRLHGQPCCTTHSTAPAETVSPTAAAAAEATAGMTSASAAGIVNTCEHGAVCTSGSHLSSRLQLHGIGCCCWWRSQSLLDGMMVAVFRLIDSRVRWMDSSTVCFEMNRFAVAPVAVQNSHEKWRFPAWFEPSR